MSSEAIATVVKMMELLPEPAQQQVAEHLRDYLMEIQDEPAGWIIIIFNRLGLYVSLSSYSALENLC